MKFVGMTDEYALTACLFHLTFGGRCTEYEIENTRATAGASTSELADLLTAADYSDPVDEALYRVARQRFDSEVQRLNAAASVKQPPAEPQVETTTVHAGESRPEVAASSIIEELLEQRIG